MKASPRALEDSEIWIHAPGVDAASLRAPLGVLGLPDRLHAACSSAGATTVVDVLALQRSEVLAAKGLGRRCWHQLKRAVCRHLIAHRRQRPATRSSGFSGVALPLRARLVLTRLGLTTREAWLSVAPDTLLAIPDLDAAAMAATHAALAATPPKTLWPPRVLRTSLLRLDLPPRLRRALAAGGFRTLGDLRCADPAAVSAIPGVGAAGLRTLRAALAKGIVLTPPREKAARAPAPSRLEKMLQRVGATERRIVESALGLRGRARTEAQLARFLDVPIEQVAGHVSRAREALLARGGKPIRQLQAAADVELTAQGGVIRASHLAQKSPLRSLTTESPGPLVALRLLAFLAPESLTLVDDVLLQLPADSYPRVARNLERAIATLPLPMPLTRAQERLAKAGLGQLSRGLLDVLLAHVPRVQIVVDPRHGDTLRRRFVTVAGRIEELLRAGTGPRQASDLLFAYRDRFGSARKARLVDTLHAEKVFLRVGPDEWDLRERHLDELELAQPEAERVRDLILASDDARSLVDLVDPGSSRLLIYLIRDLLHHDPALRSLGRGVFCSRQHRTSTHIRLLRQELNRAMGEIPLERFLGNQPETARRVRARLLAENRLFVGSSADRVDLITNYPLNEERLERLHRTIETMIEEVGGYDRVDRLAAQLRTDDVGGSFMTPHFLLDLLRRHGRFEILAGRLVTQVGSGMRAAILHRVRMVIRAADRAISVNEILSASPDLAEFTDYLPDLIDTDPLIQRCDERYALP